MTFRRFEMHHYRQVLAHMRLGESDRSIARTGIMGRTKVTELRHLAVKYNWLNPDLPLPDDVDLARHLQPRKDDNLQPSLVEPYRNEVLTWWQEGIQGTTIHAACEDGKLYTFIGEVLTRIDPGTFALESLGSVEKTANFEFLGPDIYFTGTRLRRIRNVTAAVP